MRRELGVAMIIAIWGGAMVAPRSPAAEVPPRASLGVAPAKPDPRAALPWRPLALAPLALGPAAVEPRPERAEVCPGSSTWSVAPNEAHAPTGSTATGPAVLHVPVLMYHHVMPASRVPTNERYPDLFIDAAVFDAQMAALQGAGWRTITARQLSEAVRSRSPVPSRTVVITFDDGRADNYIYAFPILKRYDFTATFFVVPGRIGTTQHMTACQLREIAAAGNELADHTWNHCDLTSLPYEQARLRIRMAADAIESLVGVRPVTLAYPYGRYNRTVEAAAGAEGMDMAFTTQRGAAEALNLRFDQPRLRVAGVHLRDDGSFGGGTTARGILWLVSS